MNICFLTEMQYKGKVPKTHTNMRTEFAWMFKLDASHYHIGDYTQVSGYDVVFIIFPKGRVFLSVEGSKIVDGVNPISIYLNNPMIEVLKESNTKVYYIQEGPHWWWNDYEIVDQIGFYNFLVKTDGIFAHNESDVNYYKGLFPNKKVEVIRSLIIEDLVNDITPITQNKTIIGGNFARWYGGFESYIVASEFDNPIWVQDSHAKRTNEEHLQNLNHLHRMSWLNWMKELSTFKYAVHLMPTVAAGTFSLNCAYFGIPVIGNRKVDTQNILFEALSVDVSDLYRARILAEQLKKDNQFYNYCSVVAKDMYMEHYSSEVWKKEIINKL
jgi:hypothetical protein